jgi:hypothetical protein
MTNVRRSVSISAVYGVVSPTQPPMSATGREQTLAASVISHRGPGGRSCVSLCDFLRCISGPIKAGLSTAR